MFHVEPLFIRLWQTLSRVLQQRNALLKHRMSTNTELHFWDEQLITTSEQIDQQRQQFVQQWQACILPVVEQNMAVGPITVDYCRGWPAEQTLAEVLRQDLANDQRQGFTHHGPQRADLRVKVNGKLAQHSLSLGQQKLLVSILVLTQALLVKQLAQVECTLLIDDMPAELDAQSREKVAALIQQVGGQAFVTAVDEHTVRPFMA